MDGAGLYVAYGACAGGDEAAETLGRKIVATVAREGLTTEADGSLHTRIHVPLD